MVIYAESRGEGEPDGNGGGISGGGGSGGSGTPVTIPDVAWPNIIAGSFDSLDLFQPLIQNSFRTVDVEGDFTESMLPEPDMTLDGGNWVHIVEQEWIAWDHWKFTEIVVMTFNVSAPSASGPGETTTVARNGFLRFRVDISRGFETSSTLGPKWTVDSDFKDKLTFNYQIGGGTTITPISGGGSPAVTRTGADLANAGPSEDDLEPDQDGNSNWSASAKLVTMVSGDFNVSSVPISAPYSWTSSVRDVTTIGEAKIELDVELGGSWSSSGSAGNLSLGAGATAPATPLTSFPEDSESTGVDGLDASTGEGFQSSASGSFETKLERDSALDWDLRGVKHDASILDIMGDVNSKLTDELKDKLTDNRFFAWRDTGVTPSGISWTAGISFGWNLTPEVSASLDAEHGLEIYKDVEGDIAADEGDKPPTAKRAAKMKQSDYDFLNLKIKGEKSSSSTVDPQNTFEKSWEGEITIAYGLITTGDGMVDIKKAVTDLSVGGGSDLTWSFDGFDLVRVKIDSKDKSFHSTLTSDSTGTFLHSEKKDNFHKLKDKLRIKFDGNGELHARMQPSGVLLLSGTGSNKLVKHVDYLEESQNKWDELNKRWGGSNPAYWSRYIIWDDRTDKFMQTVTNQNTFSAATGFTESPQQDPVGDLVPIVSGFKRYGANPDGSDLTQASNPAAINWSLLNLATGEVTSTGATGSSQSAPATPKTSDWVGWLQAGLDIAGLVPVIGEFADLANAGIYLAQGDYQLAGLSAISIIPVFGDAIGKSSKVVVKATRYMDEAAAVTQQAVKKIDLPVLGCFVGGTPVHVASLAPVPWDVALCRVASEAASEYEWLFGETDENASTQRCFQYRELTQVIEEVTLGSRTVGENPNSDDYDFGFGLPDENTWRQVHMQLDRDDGVVVDIQLLRPIDWIEASGLFVGGEYEVDLPHTSARGIARVLDIGPCPMLASGDGNLVIGRFETRDAKEVVKVTFEDGATLTGTRIHPVWSADRKDWIELGKLEIGENLQGSNGPVAVQCMTFIATSQPVYNLEIFGEHVYRVGFAGVLCHNTDPTTCTYILKPVAPSKVAIPSVKISDFGPKIADVVSKNGVPKNWSPTDIQEAISDYRTSINSRKAELNAFDLAKIGNATQRLAHARRITEEEDFLASLLKALRNRK